MPEDSKKNQYVSNTLVFNNLLSHFCLTIATCFISGKKINMDLKTNGNHGRRDNKHPWRRREKLRSRNHIMSVKLMSLEVLSFFVYYACYTLHLSRGISKNLWCNGRTVAPVRLV